MRRSVNPFDIIRPAEQQATVRIDGETSVGGEHRECQDRGMEDRTTRREMINLGKQVQETPVAHCRHQSTIKSLLKSIYCFPEEIHKVCTTARCGVGRKGGQSGKQLV